VQALEFGIQFKAINSSYLTFTVIELHCVIQDMAGKEDARGG
jgi:hypothetical protein